MAIYNNDIDPNILMWEQLENEVKQSKISAGTDSIFFRGEHPDNRTDKQWVKYMNKKYGFKWNGRD